MADRTDDTLAEVVREAIDSRLLDLHTSLPAIVRSYDDTKNTCKVQPSVRRRIDGEKETLPEIDNVLVAWPSAGGAILKMVLEAGDMVWLMFSEAAWAQYRDTGAVSDAGDETRHALSYPVAYPMARKAVTGATGAGWYTSDPVYVGSPGAAEFLALKKDLEDLRAVFVAWTPVQEAALKASLMTLFGTGPAWSWPEGTSILKGE